MKNIFAESARPFLAATLLAVISGGPLCAVGGIIISFAGIKTIDVLVAALKLV